MTIIRKYILPNCTLVLEGLSDASEEESDVFAAESLSILVNAECNFVNSNQQLSGGSVFFENLVKAVSAYAQEFLSGLPHPQNSRSESPQVYIAKSDKQHLHRLICAPETNAEQQKSEIELTTVELFDLVEAVDQFFADHKTLPSIALELKSLSKKYRQPDKPLAERATPVALGIASLAFAAAAFFLLPPPEIREPEPVLESNPTETVPTPPEESGEDR